MLDTDYLVTFKSGIEATIEVKTSSYDDKYIFFETVSDMLKGTPGCMYASTADYIFYYFINSDKCYIFPRELLVKWFDFYKDTYRFKRKVVKNRARDGGLYKTEGYLIPTALFSDSFKFCKSISLRSDI